MSVKWILPSSSSSSLTRQQRPHPSHSALPLRVRHLGEGLRFPERAASAMRRQYTPAALRREGKSAEPANSPQRRWTSAFPFTLLRFRHWRGAPERATDLNKLTGLADLGARRPYFGPAPPHNRGRRGIRPETPLARPVQPGSQGEAQALPARLRLAARFDGLPRRALAARILRALLRLHGPVPCRGLAALGRGRAAVRRRDARPRRPDRHAGARHPGVPRNLRR